MCPAAACMLRFYAMIRDDQMPLKLLISAYSASQNTIKSVKISWLMYQPKRRERERGRERMYQQTDLQWRLYLGQ